MGQKIHPEGFRLGVRRKGEKVDFKSSWYSDRDFAELLGEDLKIRDHIEKKLSRAGIADIQIRKAAEQGEIAVDIHTARPGIVIGKGGSEVDALRGDLERLTGKKVQVNVREVSRPELNAALDAKIERTTAELAEQAVFLEAFMVPLELGLGKALATKELRERAGVLMKLDLGDKLAPRSRARPYLRPMTALLRALAGNRPLTQHGEASVRSVAHHPAE